MPEVGTEDAILHVEVDGEGPPVTVLAHGLTNSCRELAQLTPLVPGTKVRFCFRGHGHSSSPQSGYRFEDFARDLDAVATRYQAEIAFGTSLGAGAICNLVAGRPERFRKLVLLLPAGLDSPFRYRDRMLRAAWLVDGKTKEEAIEAVLSDPQRVANYVQMPWLRDFDRSLMQDLNPVGVPRAIREIIEHEDSLHPLSDQEIAQRLQENGVYLARRTVAKYRDAMHVLPSNLRTRMALHHYAGATG